MKDNISTMDSDYHKNDENSENKDTYSFFSTSLLNPLNIVLMCICVVLLYKINRFRKQQNLSITKLPPLKKRDFTLLQLKEENLKNDRILVAVNGKVFDVTNDRAQYGPEGPYGIFAGRDASRMLGTFTLSGDAIIDSYDDLSDLTSAQMDKIKEWELQFTESFPMLGRLLKPGEEPTEYTDTEEESTNTHIKTN